MTDRAVGQDFDEPAITVNGWMLTEAQAMTVRVALNAFVAELREHGLGDDEHGVVMTAGYLARAHEVMKRMGAKTAPPRAPRRRR